MRPVVVAIVVVVLAACGTRQGVLSAGNSASPAASMTSSTPVPTPHGCSDPVKCSTPPPGYTPYLGPPCDAPLTTAYEIRVAAAQMHPAPGEPAPTGLADYGEPILVHSMVVGDSDEWLVPTLDGNGGATGVVAVAVQANGRGCAGMASGWSGPFPRVSVDDARRIVAGPHDPVSLIEAVVMPWTKALPPSSDTQMVWRAVRQSGHEVLLFGGGEIIEGNDVRAILQWYSHGTGLRGDPPGATPRPSPTYRPTYGVATADQVLAAARTDIFVLDYFRYLRGDGTTNGPIVQDPSLGTPVRVVGLHKPYTLDVWIVPVLDRTSAIVSIIAVWDRDGMGQAIQSRTWSGAFPRVSEAEAKRAGGTAIDPAVSAQLGWAESYYVLPGGATSAVWLVTRRSGAQVVVTEDGAVVAAPK